VKKRIRVVVFNATFNNISAILSQLALLVEERHFQIEINSKFSLRQVDGFLWVLWLIPLIKEKKD
jgi:hypothetical protein